MLQAEPRILRVGFQPRRSGGISSPTKNPDSTSSPGCHNTRRQPCPQPRQVSIIHPGKSGETCKQARRSLLWNLGHGVWLNLEDVASKGKGGCRPRVPRGEPSCIKMTPQFWIRTTCPAHREAENLKVWISLPPWGLPRLSSTSPLCQVSICPGAGYSELAVSGLARARGVASAGTQHLSKS